MTSDVLIPDMNGDLPTKRRPGRPASGPPADPAVTQARLDQAVAVRKTAERAEAKANEGFLAAKTAFLGAKADREIAFLKLEEAQLVERAAWKLHRKAEDEAVG